MKAATSIRVRRILSQLEWITGEKGHWRARTGRVELGCWGDLETAWRHSGHRVYLTLRAGPERRTLAVSSISAQGSSIRVVFEPSGGRRHPELEIDNGDGGQQSCCAGAFEESVLEWVRRDVPGNWHVRSSTRSDLSRSLSRTCIRVLALGRTEALYTVAARPDAVRGSADWALTQGLLWLSSMRPASDCLSRPRLRVLVPAQGAPSVAHRAGLLDPARVNIEVWEYGPESWDTEAPRKAGRPPAPVEDSDFRWPALGPFRWSSVLGRVVDLAPALVRRYPRFHDHDSLRIRGLEFARVSGVVRERMTFGLAGCSCELTESNFPDLESLVREILFFRRADSPSVRHPYYRLQSERWLESEILENATEFFPELEPGSIYSQIPVYLGSEPGRVDLLGAAPDGRLVVVELKVKEDPGLPLQALDYWGRVREHDRAGDFERRGYFGGRTCHGLPPRVYLVAPIFSFHDSTERLTSYFAPEIEVWKISINEDWRCGVRILRRRKLRGGMSG